MPYLKPLPTIDSDTKTYWEGCKRHELLLPYCAHCTEYFFPPRPICPHCLTADIEWRKAGGRGAVYSCSVVYQNRSPGFRDEGPYVVGYVTLEEGVQMMSNIVAPDPASVKAGQKVTLFFEDVTDQISLPKFRPA